MAKLFTSEAAWRCADRCVQAFGGRGYLRSNVAERLLRELRVDRIWEGTSEIQRLIVARGLERRGRGAHPPLGVAACPRGRTGLGRDVAAAAGELDPTPLLDPRSIAVVGANDRPGLLRRHRAAQPRPRRASKARLGREPASRRGPRPRHASESVADLPQPVDAVVVAIPAAGVPAVIARCRRARLRRRDRDLGRLRRDRPGASSWSASCATLR